jgi:hypothetical protein
MLLTALSLASFQHCPRRWLLEQKYAPLRSRPIELFTRVLKNAIFELSSGRDKKEVSQRAQVRFLTACAKPGLETPHDPYVLGQDYNAMLQTVIEAISRRTLHVLKPGPVVEIAPGIRWECEAWADDSGLLHYWWMADRWDRDKLSKILHSWQVFGDMAAAHTPLVLHVVETGRVLKGHQNSPWSRAYAHPLLMGVFRFQCQDGSKLKGNWKPVYYQDSNANTPEKWVDLMETDHVQLIHDINVREPLNEHVEDSIRQIRIEVERMKSVKPGWHLEPMQRNVCDLPPCPWQGICYNRIGITDPAQIGGFIQIEQKQASRADA